MEINKPTSFVKANVNVNQGDTVELLDEGHWEDMVGADGKKKQVLKFQALLQSGEIKGYSMNNSTIDNLTAAYGKDSRNWMRKPLKVWITKEMSFGKMKPVLRLTPLNWETPVLDEEAPAIDADVPNPSL